MERIKTGVTGLDELLGGGIPRGFVTAVVGGPGSGKSILATQFLWKGIQDGEDVLYVLLSGENNEVIRQAQQFGWNLKDNPKFHLHIITQDDTEKLVSYIEDYCKKFNVRRVVLDSLSLYNTYRRARTNMVEMVARINLDALAVAENRLVVNELRAIKDITTLVIIEEFDGMPLEDKIFKFACDGVLVLELHDALNNRAIKIAKMRETRHPLNTHNIEIGDNGITVIGKKVTI